MAGTRNVNLKILEKEFTFSCPDGAEAELLASADYLNEKMTEVRNKSRNSSLDKIAIMAALNMSHELLKSRGSYHEDTETHLKRIAQKIDLFFQSSEKDS